MKSYWQHRLQLIRPTAPPVATSHERRRRGLIDVGGQLLHSIFGLATSNQVDISRQMIKLVRASNQHIIHQTNNMVTVINQTFNEMVLNRQHIQDVERSLSDLYTHVNTWIAVRHVAWGRISASLQIDRWFLRYKIETWPFLHVASNVKLQFELPSDVAYDTTEGLMFIPHKCVGN